MGWQMQIAIMIIPTLIYAYLIFGQKFPETQELESSTLENIKALATPLFIFVALCMTLTATSELGTQQWVGKILGNAGASGMLILALWSGIMAVGRYFAGPIVHKLNPVGVLLASSVVSTLGIFLLLNSSGMLIYLSTAVFAVGLTYFWPTMIGFVGEYLPETGALGMSLVGGAGMFALTIWNPIIGKWLDTSRAEAIAQGLSQEAADLAAGQATLDNLAFFPAILIIAFTILYFWTKKINQAKSVA